MDDFFIRIQEIITNNYVDYFPDKTENERIEGMLFFMDYLWNITDNDTQDTWSWSIQRPICRGTDNSMLKEYKNIWHQNLREWYMEGNAVSMSLISTINKILKDRYIIHIKDPENITSWKTEIYHKEIGKKDAKEFLWLILDSNPTSHLVLRTT
jgi:hypothetical protein